jgi:hypothetical protein
LPDAPLIIRTSLKSGKLWRDCSAHFALNKVGLQPPVTALRRLGSVTAVDQDFADPDAWKLVHTATAPLEVPPTSTARRSLPEVHYHD